MSQPFDEAFERYWAEYVKREGLEGQQMLALHKKTAYDSWLLFHPLKDQSKRPEPPGFKFSEALQARFNDYVKALRDQVDLTKHPQLTTALIDLLAHAQMEAAIYERETLMKRLSEEWSDTLRVMMSIEPRKEQKK